MSLPVSVPGTDASGPEQPPRFHVLVDESPHVIDRRSNPPGQLHRGNEPGARRDTRGDGASAAKMAAR